MSKTASRPPPALRSDSERPTSETMRQGAYVAERLTIRDDQGRRLEDVTIMRNSDVNWIGDAHGRGKLTDIQSVAADDFAIKANIVHARGFTRSCLDDSPRGGGDGAGVASASSDLASVTAALCAAYGSGEGQGLYWLLIGVLVRGEKTGPRRSDAGKWSRIVRALDVVADEWRIGR